MTLIEIIDASPLLLRCGKFTNELSKKGGTIDMKSIENTSIDCVNFSIETTNKVFDFSGFVREWTRIANEKERA